jgi:hypothetical protein
VLFVNRAVVVKIGLQAAPNSVKITVHKRIGEKRAHGL